MDKELILDTIKETGITTKKQLGEKLGVSQYTMAYWLDKHSITLPKRKFTTIECPEINQFIDLIHSGKSIHQLTKTYRVSEHIIKRWIEENNIEYKKKSPGGKGGRSSEFNNKEFWLKQIELYDSKEEISKNLNIKSNIVHYWLKHFSIHLDGRSISPNKKSIPSKEELENLYSSNSILDISKHYGGVSNVTISKWLKDYNIPLREHSENQKLVSVPKMYETNMERYGVRIVAPSYHSRAENEIKTWLNSLGFNFHSDKTVLNGLELDGYDPEISTAFEYCGLWWHSERNGKGSRYHWNKWKLCQERGIHLFTIYENEWKDRRIQIQNFISGFLGKWNTRLEARKCHLEIYKKSNQKVSDFLEKNHIQGKSNGYEQANVLWHNGDIIGVMTFGKHPRQGNEDVKVLNRLCWKDGVTVIGGSSRLFSYRPSGKIVSWSDNRYASGDVYERLGFTLEKEYGPGYDYCNSLGKLVHKQNMQKKKIGATEYQKENERANELGWYRIWDCGKKKWIIN